MNGEIGGIVGGQGGGSQGVAVAGGNGTASNPSYSTVNGVAGGKGGDS